MGISRRQFLVGTGAAAVLAACAPVGTPAPPPTPPPAPPPPPSPTPSVLVLLFCYGGNDGLNTVIPFTDPTYRTKRGALALDESAGVRAIGNGFGLHPSLDGLHGLWGEGAVAVVHGVGYPNADRSHFRSTDIWESGRPDAIVGTGWLGRWLDTQPEAMRALAVQSTVPRTLRGSSLSGIAVSGGALTIPGSSALRNGFAQLATTDPADPVLAGLWTRSQSDLLRAQTVLNPALSAPNPAGSQLAAINTSLARSLAAVARLVRDPAVPTRVYAVNLGGFDTHADQAGTHATLLGQVDDAVTAFHRDLAADPRGGDVVTMIVSEFGRRLQTNANLGTDHGTCLPVIAVGPRVNGGHHGAAPSLTSLDNQGDPVMTTDFRRVYSTVLTKTLGADPAAVLGSSAFTPLGFL
jgi:uncharacterized protein (DUF1501 family)